MFQEGNFCIEGLIDLACGLYTAPNATEAERLFYERYRMVLHAHNTKATASAVSFSAILSCEISDFGQQLYIRCSLICVDGIIEGKATELLAN